MFAIFWAYWRTYKSYIIFGASFFYLGCKYTTFGKDEGRTNEYVPKHELDDIQYAVVVLTSPNNLYRRDTIRNTWMKLCSNLLVQNGKITYKWNHTLTPVILPNYIKFFFVVGAKMLSEEYTTNITTENETTKDLLLLEDVEDSYDHLSYKVAKTMEWFSKNMKNLKYLIKCDDDTFVRVDLVIQNLFAFAPEMSDPKIKRFVSFKNSLHKHKDLYWGLFNGGGRIHSSGKWEEHEWFLCDRYLPYAVGGCYVLSKGVVDYVGRNHQFFSHYISEDVSMSVWTAALGGINRVHDVRFDTEWRTRGCTNYMFVRHKQTIADMWAMYEYLVWSQGRALCIVSYLKRISYIYQWEVMPSKCCCSKIYRPKRNQSDYEKINIYYNFSKTIY